VPGKVSGGAKSAKSSGEKITAVGGFKKGKEDRATGTDGDGATKHCGECSQTIIPHNIYTSKADNSQKEGTPTVDAESVHKSTGRKGK